MLSLAKYDQNYDIRDRARFTRQLIVPSEQGGALSRHAKKLFLAPKPAPVLESSFKGGSGNWGNLWGEREEVARPRAQDPGPQPRLSFRHDQAFVYRTGVLTAPAISTTVMAGSASLEDLLFLSHAAFASSPFLRHLFHLPPE